MLQLIMEFKPYGKVLNTVSPQSYIYNHGLLGIREWEFDSSR